MHVEKHIAQHYTIQLYTIQLDLQFNLRRELFSAQEAPCFHW
jgi:hypothetical protein